MSVRCMLVITLRLYMIVHIVQQYKIISRNARKKLVRHTFHRFQPTKHVLRYAICSYYVVPDQNRIVRFSL
jgi:hypothetical protein